jgi:hypothetical protein
MLGAILTAAFSVACGCAAQGLLRRWMGGLDPAERWGLGGLLGLGLMGVLTLLVGILPAGLRWGLPALALAAVAGAIAAWKSGSLPSPVLHIPRGAAIFSPIYALLIGAMALVGALSPSTSMDWDSLAYHLAVPKIWLMAGQIDEVQAIHHSNFPFSIDNLYIFGLWWGGEAGAKAFSVVIFGSGGLALFGHARRTLGDSAAWWILPAYASIPVVAFALLYAAEALTDHRPGTWLLSGLSLGLCLGSKHTGLHIFVALGLAALWRLARDRNMRTLKGMALASGVALALALPWYLKSAVMTGNPVFPFFYSVLGGDGWDQWRADIYANEQQTFGVGRTDSGRDPGFFGHAVLGLAFQPGRYVNPGQDQGLGSPTGAIGAAAVLLAIIPAAMGWLDRRAKTILAAMGIGLAMWFFLSQQSRYLTIWAIPACWIGVSALAGRDRRILPALISLQAAYTLFLVHRTTTTLQLQAGAIGAGAQDYRRKMVGFTEAAEQLNEDPSVKRIALYDEVFGFLLNKPYLWANPGHSMVIPYESLDSGAAFAGQMAELGFSHAYVNLALMPSDAREKWISEMAPGGAEPSAEDTEEAFGNLDLKWRWLLADAVRSGEAQIVGQAGTGIILSFPSEER